MEAVPATHPSAVEGKAEGGMTEEVSWCGGDAQLRNITEINEVSASSRPPTDFLSLVPFRFPFQHPPPGTSLPFSHPHRPHVSTPHPHPHRHRSQEEKMELLQKIKDNSNGPEQAKRKVRG